MFNENQPTAIYSRVESTINQLEVKKDSVLGYLEILIKWYLGK